MQIPDLGDKTIIFVRHGEYRPDPNHNDRKQMLTDLGQVQAESVGIWLKRNHNDISVMWHSHMRRSRETAAIIGKTYCRDLNTKHSKRLDEFHIEHTGRIGVGG